LKPSPAWSGAANMATPAIAAASLKRGRVSMGAFRVGLSIATAVSNYERLILTLGTGLVTSCCTGSNLVAST